MPRETGQRLAAYAEDRVGEALRTVVVVYEDDLEVLFLRDDLAEQYSPEQYERTVNSFKIDLDWARSAPADEPLGSRNSLIHHFDSAFVFQFPHEDCHSILLSVEPEVGSRLTSFIEGCQERL